MCDHFHIKYYVYDSFEIIANYSVKLMTNLFFPVILYNRARPHLQLFKVSQIPDQQKKNPTVLTKIGVCFFKIVILQKYGIHNITGQSEF